MKNLSLILNGVLLVAVLVLFLLHFNVKNQMKSKISNAREKVEGNTLDAIAYINSDSLISNYQYYQDMASDLQEKQQNLQTEFQNRAQGLQQEIQSFQQSANTMTRSQAQAQQENLQQKQQNLRQYQQNIANQIRQQEQEINQDMYDRVSSFLEEYSQENNYQLVLSFTPGSGVLYADDTMNITNEVVSILNERYEEEGENGNGNGDN